VSCRHRRRGLAMPVTCQAARRGHAPKRRSTEHGRLGYLAGAACGTLPSMRILIVDQERTFADALATRLEVEPDMAVALKVCGPGPAPPPIVGRHPDVVLLDADLPGTASLLQCEELAGRANAPRLVMLSRGVEPERIADAIRAGADAWVAKSDSLDYLMHVIRRVAAGETWLPPAQLGEVLRLLQSEREHRSQNDRLLAALTPREREVLRCLADGAGRGDVAARLHLSRNTVRTHLQNLMAKLGVHSTLEAVALTRTQLGAPANWRAQR
jgi:DNA-binding NarL/FixJ family response regulator